MDPFRLLLLAVGIILLLAVYFITKRATQKPSKPRQHSLPMSGDVDPPERPYQASFEARKPRQRKRFVKFMNAGSSGSSAGQNLYQQAGALEPFDVIVYVMPHAVLEFRREQVIACLETVGCIARVDGEDVSYDYLLLDDEQGKRVKRLFTVSDVHQPGIFCHSSDAPQKTSSLVFKMELPGPMESVMAFERLLEVARRIATKLNGVVCDDLQNRLTRQTTLHIKDKIVDYNRKLQFVHSLSVQ